MLMYDEEERISLDNILIHKAFRNIIEKNIA